MCQLLSQHDYRFSCLPRPGIVITTAWYIVYHGLVHRLPRPGKDITTRWYKYYQMVVQKLVNRNTCTRLW